MSTILEKRDIVAFQNCQFLLIITSHVLPSSHRVMWGLHCSVIPDSQASYRLSSTVRAIKNAIRPIFADHVTIGLHLFGWG